MATDIQLTSAVRTNLLALQNTQDLISRTQGRLSTGLRVASPLDDGRAFFEAKALSDRASDIAEKKDGIDQAISSVKVTLDAVNSIDSIVKQLKGISIGAKDATGAELTAIVAQYNELKTQIDNLASDAVYQGTNLVNGTGTTLTVEFGTSSTSILNIPSVDITTATTGLNITAVAASATTTGELNFATASDVEAALAELDTAISGLRGHAQGLGSRIALLQTRLDFTTSYVNNLEEGAGKLTLADINEEGANLVALQTRQQLGVSALAFAGQSEQSVLQLFN